MFENKTYLKLVGGVGGMYSSSLRHSSAQLAAIFPFSIAANSRVSLTITLFLAMYWTDCQSVKHKLFINERQTQLKSHFCQNGSSFLNHTIAVIFNNSIQRDALSGHIPAPIQSDPAHHFPRRHARHSDLLFEFTVKGLLFLVNKFQCLILC